MLIAIFFLAWEAAQEVDIAIKMGYTSIAIPLFLLQNVMLKKMENNRYNIDLYMEECVKGEVVWRARNDSSKINTVYLRIKNTGNIDMKDMLYIMKKY